MANITYSVMLTSSGRQTVTVTGDDPVAVSKAVQEWGMEQCRVLHDGSREAARQETVEEPAVPVDSAPSPITPVCRVHHKEMALQAGKHGNFWSCHERNANGSFCNYRPEHATA